MLIEINIKEQNVLTRQDFIEKVMKDFETEKFIIRAVSVLDLLIEKFEEEYYPEIFKEAKTFGDKTKTMETFVSDLIGNAFDYMKNKNKDFFTYSGGRIMVIFLKNDSYIDIELGFVIN